MTQFKRIFIPYNDQTEVTGIISSEFDDNHFEKWCPVDSEETNKADKEIEQHLNDGWRIVSSCPIVGTFSLKSATHSEKINNFVFTDGIEVLLVKD